MASNEAVSISKQIGAVLFYKGEPVSLEDIKDTLEVSLEEVQEGVVELEKNLEGSGAVLVLEGGCVQLGTDPQASGIIEKMRKQEISGDLGKAALECLTIVLYRGPIARPDIDYIRGVNSQFILRRLCVRGLVEKQLDPENSRRMLYTPTLKLLSHLGITHFNDLPEYEKVEERFEQMKEVWEGSESGVDWEER